MVIRRNPEFNAQVYLWCVGNLLLAAASPGELTDEEDAKLSEALRHIETAVKDLQRLRKPVG